VTDPKVMKCQRCSHVADDHRLDDATNVSPDDSAAQFRCIYPSLTPGVSGPACDCPDFDAPMEYVEYFENLQ
jgi:hypothetical protein